MKSLGKKQFFETEVVTAYIETMKDVMDDHIKVAIQLEDNTWRCYGKDLERVIVGNTLQDIIDNFFGESEEEFLKNYTYPEDSITYQTMEEMIPKVFRANDNHNLSGKLYVFEA